MNQKSPLQTSAKPATLKLQDVEESAKNIPWAFPLEDCPGIPDSGHPGAYLTKRKHHTHTGVDLYTKKRLAPVKAAENGHVVQIGQFTGKAIHTPWWEDTYYVLIEGPTGVICYGEIKPKTGLKIGDPVKQGQTIGHVIPVLRKGKERPDIQGHNRRMLHLELYKHGIHKAFEEQGPRKNPWSDLKDPTPHLLSATNAPQKRLKPTRPAQSGDPKGAKTN